MAREFYPKGGMDDDDAAPMEAGDGEGEEMHESKEEGMDGETAMLPKSILAGKDFNPGDEVVLKIVKMHGDEVEVSYAKEKGEDEDGEEPEAMERQNGPRPEMDGVMGKIGSMGGGY